jgi:predicted transcriptional regulator
MKEEMHRDDLDHEDAETLAAIDEGLRDIEAGRVVPAEEVREWLKKWISKAAEKKKQNRTRDNG